MSIYGAWLGSGRRGGEKPGVPVVCTLVQRGDVGQTGGPEQWNSGVGSSGRRVGSETWVRSFTWQEEERALGEQEGGLGRCLVMAGTRLGSVDFAHRHWEAPEHWGQRKGGFSVVMSEKLS